MASDPEDHPGRPESSDEDGGPVKSFLEHLEDLRWTLIKCVVTVVVGMVICFAGSNYLLAILAWPINHPWVDWSKPNQGIVVHWGTKVLELPPGSLLFTNQGNTNPVRSFSIVPVPSGANSFLLTAQPDPEPFPYSSRRSPDLKGLGPMAPMVIAMKLALWGGLLLSVPFLSYFVGTFVLPALRVREKSILFQAVGFGSGLFILGVLFCYSIMGITLAAIVQFSDWMDLGSDIWSAEAYISFVTKFMLAMGLSFELPVVILVLVKIGLLDYQKLAGFRTYMVVVNLVASAIITPTGDPFTMILFAAPLQILYEISVFVAWWWERKDRKLREAEERTRR